MDKKIPPQLLLLAIIAQSKDGLSINALVDALRDMHRNGRDIYYSLGKRIDIGIPNEVVEDINVLKLLELVEEKDGKLIATRKAYDLLTRLKGYIGK
ncbi:MAG: hypothetical protein QXJ22_06905 [Ignisphaera sp.]